MINSAFEMIISVTNTMVKIWRRGNFNKCIVYRSSSTMVSTAEMIISPTKKMVEAANEMVDFTKTEVPMTEMIFSTAKKIMSAAEAIFSIANTMVLVTQIIIAEANKMLSIAKKMLFVPATVL